MRLRILSRLTLCALVLACCAAKPESIDVPDLGRFLGTWLWVGSDGLVATSTPETKGAARTLILNPDLSYEFHERRDARDSLLCGGRFSFSEQSQGSGDPSDYIEFDRWFEPYERRMFVDFEGPDTLHLVGDPCENCPAHTFVRGQSAIFRGGVKRGERYARDLWDGLRFELVPTELGWEIAILDTTRPEEDLSRFTPPLHGPNPTHIEGWNFRNRSNTGPNLGDVNSPQRSRDFIFSRELGKSIPDQPAGPDSLADVVERVERYGRGILTIADVVLTPPAPGRQAGIESMRFTVAIEEVRPRASKGARP